MKSLVALYPSQYRKYVYGLHGAEVLKQALYKCAELRMKKSNQRAYQMFYRRIFSK